MIEPKWKAQVTRCIDGDTIDAVIDALKETAGAGVTYLEIDGAYRLFNKIIIRRQP